MIAVLDTETHGSPGLPKNPRARVVELAAVALDPHDNYQEAASYVSFVFPAGTADEDLAGARERGMPVEAILGARGEAEVRREFSAWMREHNVLEVWSYNRAFDEVMLKRSGYVLPWGDCGCVMRLARTHMPRRRYPPPLAEATGYFGVFEPGEAHRALHDARQAGKLLAALLQLR